jgi:hypothetical protein
MSDKKELTMKEALALNHWDDDDFLKVFILSITLGQEIAEATRTSISPDMVEDKVREKMVLRIGKQIPGTENVFTAEMCEAIVNLYGHIGHLQVCF